MKIVEIGLTPLDAMLREPPRPYTPGSLAKKPRGSTPPAAAAEGDADEQAPVLC